MTKKLLLSITINLVLFFNGYADSLWVDSGSDSIYNNKLKFKVGDVVTVEISAESTAVQEAGTTTRTRSDIAQTFILRMINIR